MKNKMDIFRPTWVEINLSNLAFNYQQVKRLVGRDVKVLAPIKANAYGHGMVEVSRKLVQCGVDYLGVASVEEANDLRKAKIKIPILILGTVFSLSEIKQALKLKATITVPDYRTAKILNHYASGTSRVRVQIKVDTGMGRLGIWHKQAELTIKRILKLKNLYVEGIYTHFPSADTDIPFTNRQVKAFEQLLQRLKRNTNEFAFTHASNSSAVGRLKTSSLNMVRPGIMLYGMYPHRDLEPFFDLKPVLTFKTKITYLKQVPAGRSISYGRTYITRKKTKIATIPAGYADGYMRALSNKAQVLVRGKFAPVVGRVCMDQTMIDVGGIKGVKLGDTVVLIGRQKQKSIRTEELARICNTIPYEVTCCISARVKRVFKNY